MTPFPPVLRPRGPAGGSAGSPPRAGRAGQPVPTPPADLRQPIRRVHLRATAGQLVRDYRVGFARWLYVAATAFVDPQGSVQGDATLQDSFWLRVQEGDAFRIGIGLFVRISNGFETVSYEYTATHPNGASNAGGTLYVDLLLGEDFDGLVIAPQAWGLVTWAAEVPGAAPKL